MADDENTESGDSEAAGGETSQPDGPCSGFRMELVDSLPGGRAVIGVEQEDEFVWLASKEHVSPQAVDEFTEQITRIVTEGWWVQNWSGAH
jgi:hypothetical protein